MSYFGTPLYPASLPDQTAVVSIVGNTTLAAGASTYNKNYIVTGAGGYTITLPAIDGTNWPSKSFSIYNNSSALCTINTNGTDTALLLGSSYTSMSILPGERFLIQNMVTSWVVALESASRTTTAPLFDNTIRTASTAFVKQASGQHVASSDYALATTLALTTAHIGSHVYFNGSGVQTTILPNESGLPIGATITISKSIGSMNGSAFGVTVSSYSGNSIIDTSIGLGSSVLTGSGETSVFVWQGSYWNVYGSSRLIAAMSSNASLAGTGYQCLPGGLIIQWGATTLTTTTTSSTISLPIAFPTAMLRGSCVDTGASCWPYAVAASGTSQIIIYAAPYPTNYSTGAIAAKNASAVSQWIVIGF